MLKPDELTFMRLVLNRPEDQTIRDLINTSASHIPHQRCWYYLRKWCNKGWYDYGVTLDLGWLTPAGKAYFQELCHNETGDRRQQG